jgi:predicted dehydrogenase
MSKQLGFGFVGTGEIAIASATAVRDAGHATLARVYDTRADLAHDLAAQYGGKPAGSTEELLADPAVEAVSVDPHLCHSRGTAGATSSWTTP